MTMYDELKENLQKELENLHMKKELSKSIGPDYFEPGMMEYLDQFEGLYDSDSGEVLIRFESKGTRYDGRTEQIEKVRVGDLIKIIRDQENPFNSNNFVLHTRRERDVGNMPAELCNAIAPLFDSGRIVFESAVVSFVEPISKRSRHAKQAMLFVELKAKFVKKIDIII